MNSGDLESEACLSITIDQQKAREKLIYALEWANSDRPVPQEWEEFAAWTFAMKAKTYTPALGTALLARSVDSRIDPLSIKANYAANSYSLRTLGHGVLVPSASEFGFSIRNTGREPLNNQPFFRYDHMSLIDRPLYKDEHRLFIEGINNILELDEQTALSALAAYLKVALGTQHKIETRFIETDLRDFSQVFEIVRSFLGDQDRPKRTQALVAGAFDVVFSDVRTRRLNDPSRDFPGDIQVYLNEKPILAVEVRAKSVPATEVARFVVECRNKNIERAVVVVIWPQHIPLPFEKLRDAAIDEHGILLNIIENEKDLIFDVFGWTDLDIIPALQRFTRSVLERLVQIEATSNSLHDWVSLVEKSPYKK